MKRMLAVFALIALPHAVLADDSFCLSLEDAKAGSLPQGWTAAKTGQGPGSQWTVVDDSTAPGGKALAQTSDEGPRRLFNLCVAEATSFKNVDVSVSFKAIAGKIDQGGGPVWRYQDADNYYVARMNPLEDNYRVYKVADGKRTQLGSADVTIPAGQWHDLRVVQIGQHIRCYLDGKLLLDVVDDTFPLAGKVGLWTKADAQTRFAAFKAAESPDPQENDVADSLPPAGQGKAWKLVWHDEFDGTSLDQSKWDVLNNRRRDGWWSPEAVALDGQGNLAIRTLKQGNKYLNGCVRTRGKFEHAQGYYVARIKLQSQHGHWSAFWLYNTSVGKVGDEGRDGSEIDIMDTVSPCAKNDTEFVLLVDTV